MQIQLTTAKYRHFYFGIGENPVFHEKHVYLQRYKNCQSKINGYG